MDDLLKKYDLLQYSSTLKDFEILDLETLKTVIKKPQLFELIVPQNKLGPRAKFLDMCNEVSANDNDINIPVIEVNGINHSGEIVAEFADNSIQNSASHMQIVNVLSEGDGIIIKENQTIQVEDIPKTPKLKLVSDFNLLSLLDNHPVGKGLVKLYQVQKFFLSREQLDLCEIIALHFLQLLPTTNLVFEDFEFLAYKIHQLFPNEERRTYCVPPVKKKVSRKNKPELMGGKLVNKYQNLKSKMNRVNKLLNENSGIISTSKTSSEKNSESGTAEYSKNWLMHNRTSENDVIFHWNQSYDLRKKEIDEINSTFASMLKSWPIIKESYGYKLIQIDFYEKFQVPYDLFVKNWNDSICKILMKFERNLTDSEKEQLNLKLLNTKEISEDCRNYIKFGIINYFLPEKGNKNITCTQDSVESAKGPKQAKIAKDYWKPSIVESREGIMMVIKASGDIESIVLEKRQAMKKRKLNLQPFIIIIGDGILSVEKIYIRVDDVMYELDSLLNALYVLYQVYTLFNMAYPVESENLSYFIQWNVLNLKTDSDSQKASVFAFIKKLKLKD